MRFSISAVSLFLLASKENTSVVDAFLSKEAKTSTSSSTILNALKSSSSLNDVSWQELTNKLSSTIDATASASASVSNKASTTATTASTSFLTQQQDKLAAQQSLEASQAQLFDLKQLSHQLDDLMASFQANLDTVSTLTAPSFNSKALESATQKLQSTLQSLSESLQQFQIGSETSSSNVLSPSILSNIASQLSHFVSSLQQALFALNTPETVLISAALSFWAISTVLSWGQPPPPSQPYPLQTYDPLAAQVYFDQRPLQVVGRALFIATQSLKFGLSLLQDSLTKNKWEQNMEKRGLELAELLTQLGPTFIKSKPKKTTKKLVVVVVVVNVDKSPTHHFPSILLHNFY
jgi:hypothetical protein